MSRQIPAKASLKIPNQEAACRNTTQGKVLFTSYRERNCAFLIQKNRLTAACVLSETVSKIGAVYIGKIKNMVKNIDACFVEISDGEICFLPLKKAVFPYLLNRVYDGRLVEGDTLLVQVERDAQKSKQASVTAHISLSNDYFVVTMGSKQICYSSKFDKGQREMVQKNAAFLFGGNNVPQNGELTQSWDNLLSESSRMRLEEENISTKLLPMPPTGCIVRTRAATKLHMMTGMDAAEEKTFPEDTLPENISLEDTLPENILPGNTLPEDTLSGYFFHLTEQYARLLHTARYRSCFTCLKEAPCAVESILQGLAAEHEYQEIVTDSKEFYEILSEYGSSHEASTYNNIKPLRLYQDEMLSLSKLYSIESRMKTALGSRVWLKSGGYLIIEPTEALTVIDVNSGKYEAGKSNEETALTVNLEAAEEVALQLRLRNLSGIIIVDFINMTQQTSKNQIMALLKHLTARDRVKTTVVDMTPLGLVEITRKKTSRPLREQLQ